MKTGRIVFFFLLLSFISNLSAKNIPDWVKSPPINKNYYIGIGVAAKSGEDQDHLQIARDNALRNLASEIMVNVSGEVLSEVIEKSGVQEEEIRSSIQTSTQADLDGFELVDSYEDQDNFWVYYRLSREVYQRKKQGKIEKALDLAVDMFIKARKNEQDGNIEKALLYFLQALKPLEKYIGESLKAAIDGKDIFLTNEIYSAIQNILSNIEIRPLKNKLNAKINKPLESPVEIKAEYSGQNIITNLPLNFNFIRGSADFVPRTRTDLSGIGKCIVTKITSSEKLQMISCKLDISSLCDQDSTSFLYQNILKSFPLPETKIILNVSGLSFYIESEETNLGNQLSIPYIEPKLKEILSDHGFSFCQDISYADLTITIKSKTRQGAEAYGMYSAFADLTISVVDMSSGEEVYKNSFSNVKGIDIDFQKAGVKALVGAGKNLEKIIPEIIRKL